MKIKTEIFEIDRLEFYADFFLVPLYIITLMHDNSLPLRWVVLCVAAGIFGWTFIEYAVHRFFHDIQPFRDHHQKPKDLIGTPPWVTFGLTAAIWVILFFFTSSEIASALTTGLLIGYIAYAEIHLRLHHDDAIQSSRLHWALYPLYLHHCGHHRGGTTNFGVSTTFWDHVFRTKS